MIRVLKNILDSDKGFEENENRVMRQKGPERRDLLVSMMWLAE